MLNLLQVIGQHFSPARQHSCSAFLQPRGKNHLELAAITGAGFDIYFSEEQLAPAPDISDSNAIKISGRIKTFSVVFYGKT